MRHKIRTIIALLSTALSVGGVAIVAFSAMHYHSAFSEAGRDYLPAMQQAWSTETPTSGISSITQSTGTYIGELRIRSLKLKVNIFEGTEKSALSKGAGHYIRSVMPGESDNSVIAGHRDTVFATLGKIKKGATIEITTRTGTFDYLVTSTRIVDKNDRSVIVPTESATLTLSTCYPFRFVGSAPQRFVVTGQLVAKIS